MKIEFPTVVYRTPGNHHRAGGTYDYRGAGDQSQLEALIAQGWFLTLPEAISGVTNAVSVPNEDDQPTREELEAKAKELGINFDGRTTDKSLSEKIEHVLGEQE